LPGQWNRPGIKGFTGGGLARPLNLEKKKKKTNSFDKGVTDPSKRAWGFEGGKDNQTTREKHCCSGLWEIAWLRGPKSVAQKGKKANQFNRRRRRWTGGNGIFSGGNKKTFLFVRRMCRQDLTPSKPMHAPGRKELLKI